MANKWPIGIGSKTHEVLILNKILLALLISATSLPVMAERIRDLVTVQGVRDNALIGYELVVGLDGSGASAAGGSVQVN